MVFFVRIAVVAVVLLVVEVRRCKGKIFFFFFTVNVHVEKMPAQTRLEHANLA